MNHLSQLRLRDHHLALLVALTLVLVLVVACLGTTGRFGPTTTRTGDEIVVCGEYFDIGTPVVLWSDPGGYDAYSDVPRFEDPPLDERGQPIRKRRYGARGDLPEDVTRRVAEHGWTRDDLSRVVGQFVIHYDVCGTSRQCFKILQDKRDLSVHFLLDVDGTIYQTLDLKERAWHGGPANNRSVGIEIAHIGAYPAPGHPVMRSWYATDALGPHVTFPKWMAELGIRTPGFVARPEKKELLHGEIHGKTYWMHDFTAQQHAALARLTAALTRVLPGIRLDVPRDAAGAPRTDELSQTELAAFSGVLGHYHVTDNKTDPGPALDWERLLRDAERARSEL